MDPTGEKTLDIMSSAVHYNEWLFSKLKPFLKSPVVEIGSGTGTFTKFLLDRGYDVTALDLNPHYISQIKSKLPKAKPLTLDLTTNSIPKNLKSKFNSAIMLNVLEHISDSQQALSNIYEMLLPNGKLIILVPSHNWAYGTLDRELGHVKRYSKQLLSSELKNCKFTPSRMHHLNLFGIFGWWFNGTVLKRKILPQSQVKAFDWLSRPLLAAEKLINPPLGLSLFCVAEKI